MFINKAIQNKAVSSLTIIGTIVTLGLVGCATVPTPTADVQTKLVFSCTTDNEKTINVYQIDGNFIYSFGRAGKPAEITLTKSSSDVIKTPWNGAGYEKNQSIGFINESTIYSVYSSYERKVDGKAIGGVIVDQSGNNKDINISCRTDSMVDNIHLFVE